MREPRIVRVLTDLGYMRELGEGVPRMFEVMEREGLKPPEFQLEAGAIFTVILHNTPVYSPQTMRWLRQFDGIDLSPNQKRLLAYAHAHGGQFTSRAYQKLVGVEIYTASSDIKELIRRGIVRLIPITTLRRDQSLTINYTNVDVPNAQGDYEFAIQSRMPDEAVFSPSAGGIAPDDPKKTILILEFCMISLKKTNAFTNRQKIVFASVVGLIGFAAIVSACTIPVFQYALDYWPPDAYEVIVFHQGALSVEAGEALNRLQKAESDEPLPANIRVRTMEVAESSNLTAKIPSTSQLPWMTVRYPIYARASGEVWSGAFTMDAVEMVLDSPARKEVARRLVDGESGVWVLLESGLQEQDDAAARSLNGELLKMSLNLKVAIPDENGAPQHEGGVPVEFSMLRLSRTDPAEGVFVQMLLGTEWDLKMTKSPIAFPVFGRGRALYALIGDGINAENIKSACEFLTGWCSCQVKDLNPGVDLLISTNWGGTIGEDSALSQDTLSMLGLSDSAVSDEESGSPVRRNIMTIVLIQMLIVIAIAAGIVVWRVRRSRT